MITGWVIIQLNTSAWKIKLNNILETVKERDDDLCQGLLGLVEGNEFQHEFDSKHISSIKAKCSDVDDSIN